MNIRERIRCVAGGGSVLDERKRAPTIALFHGTSLKRWRRIKGQGLDPSRSGSTSFYGSSGRASGEGPDFSTFPVTPHGGVYLTRSMETASEVARAIAKDDDSAPVVVYVQVAPGEMIPDEDKLKEFARRAFFYAAPRIGGDQDRTAYVWVRGQESSFRAEFAEDFSTDFLNSVLSGRGYADEFFAHVENVGRALAWDVAARYAAYTPREYFEGIAKEQVLALPAIPTPAEGERRFRKGIDRASRSLKQIAQHHRNARVRDKITFRGRTRIVAAQNMATGNFIYGRA